MAQYTDKQKALVIELIARNGGVISKDVLQSAREMLNAPKLQDSTLYRWYSKRENLKVSAGESQAIKKALDDVFENAARTYLERALDPQAVEKTSGHQAMMTAAVAVDKMRLLRNLPTEIVGIMPDLMASIKLLGQDPYQFLQALKDKLDQQAKNYEQ